MLVSNKHLLINLRSFVPSSCFYWQHHSFSLLEPAFSSFFQASFLHFPLTVSLSSLIYVFSPSTLFLLSFGSWLKLAIKLSEKSLLRLPSPLSSCSFLGLFFFPRSWSDWRWSLILLFIRKAMGVKLKLVKAFFRHLSISFLPESISLSSILFDSQIFFSKLFSRPPFLELILASWTLLSRRNL